jgi:putative solute:sodium symporter small subunit
MENSTNDYHISFFKPANPHAKANRNMIVWLVLIWFIAIFGFHILLRLIEKPTPEPAYITFESVWENVKEGSDAKADLQEFGKSMLSVLGKVNILPEERSVLDNGLSWSVYELTSDSNRMAIVSKIQEFEKLKESITNISDLSYIEAKKELGWEASSTLNLPLTDIRSKILPLELVSADIEKLTEDTKANIPVIMEKYLIHNQSVLTDMKFLGFPFHYFYTAVFLLILFVGLCWLYCVKTDQLNAKYNIVD